MEDKADIWGMFKQGNAIGNIINIFFKGSACENQEGI